MIRRNEQIYWLWKGRYQPEYDKLSDNLSALATLGQKSNDKSAQFAKIKTAYLDIYDFGGKSREKFEGLADIVASANLLKKDKEILTNLFTAIIGGMALLIWVDEDEKVDNPLKYPEFLEEDFSSRLELLIDWAIREAWVLPIVKSRVESIKK